MNQTKHKVAILLATYNGEKYLREFLESLSRSTFQDFVLYIRDDVSTDETINIISSYEKILNIMMIASHKNLGPGLNFMKILEAVPETHSYYFFADQDDIWKKNKIQAGMDHLSGKQGPALYICKLEIVDSLLNHIRYSKTPKHLNFPHSLIENDATGCSICMNIQLLKVIKSKIPDQITMHDWWVYIIACAIGVVVYDDTSHIKYRQHNNNSVGVSKNIYLDIVKKTKRFFFRPKQGIFSTSDQAKIFLNCFENILDPEKVIVLHKLIDGKLSFLSRIKLVFTSDFNRNTRIDTFLLKLLFLLNKY